MTCPQCKRSNARHRRYCGGCGLNLEPVCQRCAFSNEPDDHYCGGCGVQLLAGVAANPPVGGSRPAAAPPRLAIVDSDTITAAELAEMLAPSPAEAVSLPQGTIDQGDLDRLFGDGA